VQRRTDENLRTYCVTRRSLNLTYRVIRRSLMRTYRMTHLDLTRIVTDHATPTPPG
jgi:chromosome condensin MukBEF complex kleisin-like MukF subunit